MTSSEARARLARWMNESRARQQISWEEVARRAGISVSLIRAIRANNRPLTLDSKVALERGLSWNAGDVDGILASPNHLPGSGAGRVGTSGSGDTTELMNRVLKGETTAALDLLATLKAVSDDAFWEGFQFIADARAALRLRTIPDAG